MRFSRKRQIDLIPSVPDDKTDRREAIVRAQRKLDEAKRSVPEAMRVVEAIQRHDSHNHYAQRIRYAYGVEAPHD